MYTMLLISMHIGSTALPQQEDYHLYAYSKDDDNYRIHYHTTGNLVPTYRGPRGKSGPSQNEVLEISRNAQKRTYILYQHDYWQKFQMTSAFLNPIPRWVDVNSNFVV